MNELHLRDLVFAVSRARLKLTERGIWHLEIDTEGQEIDGELWSPSLYHNGLKLEACRVRDLDGASTSWSSPESEDYTHPELAILYVFGHELVKRSRLSFRLAGAQAVEVHWTGQADVLWDEPYAEGVPFSCVCIAQASDA